MLAPPRWRPAGLGPEAMLSAQMIAVQMALKSAVAQVEDAVRRVEDKVELVLEVARAQRAGDVLGNNLTISRMVDSLDKYGSLPDAYWDSVAALGPALNVTVEQLRNHVGRILASFDDNLPVQQRAAKLRNATNDNRLGDALSLLVVAEESLHKWQRLNLARIESMQPEQLLRAIDEARELVGHHLGEDVDIYRNATEILDRFAKSEAIDGFRFSSVRELAQRRRALRDEFDSFAQARHTRWRPGRTSTFRASSMPPWPPSEPSEPRRTAYSRSSAGRSFAWGHNWQGRCGAKVPKTASGEQRRTQGTC